MASDSVFDMERGMVIKWPHSRARTLFIGAVGLLTLLVVWTVGTGSPEPRLGLSTFTFTPPWTAPATPATGPPATAAAAPEGVLSGDHENADFPAGVGYTGNVALIMEEQPAAVPNFAAVVTAFRATLDPAWEMVILTRRGWAVPASGRLRAHLAAGTIKVRFLPPAADTFPTHAAVSLFLTSPWLWEQFEAVHRLLLFQPDSTLCANANTTVDDFLHWDFIGAPMAARWVDSRAGFGPAHPPHPAAQYFNGGLCLRNPRLFLALARRYDFRADLYSRPSEAELPNFLRFEDHWFMRKLEDTPDLWARARLPSPEVAGRFAVETWFFDAPLGYHQPHRWLPDRYDEIARYCPEVGMIYNMEMPDARWG